MNLEDVTQNIARLSAEFAQQRKERQRRRELDPKDFDLLREAGLLLATVPVEHGGLWESMPQTGPVVADFFRVIAHADSSLALVSSMHPAVVASQGVYNAAPVPAEYQEVWEEEKRWIFQTVLDGAWWAPIASEPGSGGDTSNTKAVARRGQKDGEYYITGIKHFGSGTGMASYMTTPAVPEGASDREGFILDMRGVPLDGSAGAKLVAPWDGHGMIGTQSHAVMFEDFPAKKQVLPTALFGGDRSSGFAATCWTGVATGIVEIAMETAREQLGRRDPWRAYEQVEWAKAEVEAWTIQQAYAGVLRSLKETGGRESRYAKMAIARLAEKVTRRLCRIIGGGTYSRTSPFGFWFEDVRALGFLRPPWALAHDRLFEASWPKKD